MSVDFINMAKEMKAESRKYRSLAEDVQKNLRADLSIYLNKNPNKALFYQKQQLFIKSVDASGEHGEALGFYSKATEVISEGKKKYNAPYTMVDSGAFKQGMTFKMKYNKMIFSSSTPKLSDILNNDVFRDLELLGLNGDSLRRFNNNVIKPFIKSWIEERS